MAQVLSLIFTSFRGLPHAHIAVWLDPRDAPKKAEDLDHWTTAEIPDKTTSPELHDLVKRFMIHGPCGQGYRSSKQPPCMKSGKCEKGFPKEYSKHSIYGESVSPQYRRRSPADGGHEVHVYTGTSNYKLDNRNVVPHNRYIDIKTCMNVLK